MLGDYRAAIEFHKRTAEYCANALNTEQFPYQAAFSRAQLAFCLGALGRFDEGIAYGEDAVRIADGCGDRYAQVDVRWRLGHLYLRKGDVDRAVHRLEEGRTLCESYEMHYVSPVVASFLGSAYAHAGRIPEALRLLEHGIVEHTAKGLARGLGALTRVLAEGYLLAGRVDDAAELAQRALALSREHGERGSEANALVILGDIAAHPDRFDAERGETHYRQALGLAEPRDMRPLVAHCHLGLGKLYRRTGQREQAQEHLTTATTMYREMDMRFYLEQAEAAMREPT
jgi:tetratricopeptide (TPR) repeat protein